MSPSPPELGIAGYEGAALVGEGGFATVYRAYQPALNRLVAVKLLTKVRLDERTLRRFDRERTAIGSLSGHPNIVTVYESGVTTDGTPYLAMEYLPNGSLADRLAREGPLPWPEVARIGVRLAGALESAHQAGILHRDLKPENVLVSSFAEPLLTDFGIARVVDGPDTRTVDQAVSVAHAAPEVLNGEDFSRRSDVYSLGSTLFTLLWGRPPFLHADDELFLPILVRVASQPPPDLRSRGVPEPVCRALERAMAKQPGDRPASALDLAADLAQAEAAHGLAPTVPLVVGLGTGPPGPGPAGPATRTSPPAIATATATTPAPPRARRGRRPVLVGVVLLLAVAAAATVFAQRDPPTSPTRLGADADTTTSGASTTATSSTVPVAAVPFPSTSGTLPAGRYVATRFGAPFQFDLPEGWRAPSPDDQDQLELIRATGDGDSALTFVQPGRVFDPQLAPTTAAETRGAVRSAPVDLVQWIRSHPRLAAGDALPVTKGSLPGTALDVRPTVGYLHDDCLAARPGRRCVLLFVNEDGAFYSLAEGFRARFHLLRVGDQTLVAAIEAPAAQFDAFAPVAEQVLATLGRRP